MPTAEILRHLTIDQLTVADVDAFGISICRDPDAAHRLGLEALAIANPTLLPHILALMEERPNIGPLALFGILALHAHNQALEGMVTDPSAGGGV